MIIEFNLELFYPVIAFIVVIFATWFIAHFLGHILERLLKHNSILMGLQIKRLVWIFIWIIGLLFAVEQLGLRIDLLLLLVGLLGIALIIANKETFQNFASKYFCDEYMPFRAGDSIKVREHSGRVIEINPMSTIILTDKEELISIPNSFFMKEVITNTTPQAWKELTIPLIIGNEIDLAEFESEVLKSCNKYKQHFDERFPPLLSVQNRDQKSTELELTLMIKDPNMKEILVSNINRRISEIIGKLKEKKK